MLTGHTSVSDKVAAFQLGANDYVTKPAHPTELSARVQAHLDLKFSVEENARAREQLMNAHRLQGVGRLAAGLAHEINTPAQYISDNQEFLRKAMSGFREVLGHIRGWSTGEPLGPDAAARVKELWKERRLDYLLDETPHALDQCTEGINRIVQLINDLKTFTDQPKDKALQPASLNGAIENTLAVSRSEWDELATLSLNLDPTLPEIPCKLPELRHALLNIIDNSVHAFRGDFGGELRAGTIEIVSRRVEGGAEVVISDNGPGIKAAIRPHVFDPFFTTKEVGRGSGQGLAIGYNVIVNQHGGRLICEDNETGGARFRLWLPLEHTDPT
jgi:signal transduction histidine kinase